MSAHEEGLWKAPDVMAYLKASRSWVYQKAAEGILPSLRICGFLRFDPQAVRAFALSREKTGAVIPLRKPGAAR